MKTFLKLTWVDTKLFTRNWVSAFFTLAFPVLTSLLFGSMYGNQPTPVFGGYGSVDVMVPGYIASMVIGGTAFMGLPLELVLRRQTGVLRRLRATSLSPLAMLGSQVAVNALSSIIGALLLILTGSLAFGGRLPSDWLQFGLGFLFSCICLYALSFCLAGLFRSVTAARAVCMSLFFPMMFISGGTLPAQFLPAGINRAAQFLPVTHMVTLLKGLYLGQGWNLTALAVLAGSALISALIAVRLFRWD